MAKKVLMMVLLALLVSTMMPASVAVAQEGEKYKITLLDTTVSYKGGKDREWKGDTTRGPWEIEVPKVDGWIGSKCEELTGYIHTTGGGGLKVEYFDSGGKPKPCGRRDIVNGGKIRAIHTAGYSGSFVLWRSDQKWHIQIYFVPAAPVPDVVGMSQSEAEAVIAEACLVVGEVTEVESDKPIGIVRSQDPKAGTVVRAGSSVDILVTREKPNQPPECSFGILPQNPTSDDPVVCVSTSTDPDGDPLTYEWYLNGNYGGDFPSCELGKLEPGDYLIELLVDDGKEGGTVKCSRMITVVMGYEGGDTTNGGDPDYVGGLPTFLIPIIEVTYLDSDGNVVSEVGTLVDPCNPNFISLDVYDALGEYERTIIIDTDRLLCYTMFSEIYGEQLYPAQFYIPFRPEEVITPTSDFSIMFIRDAPRPKNIMFAGGSWVTPDAEGMNWAGWYHFFVSGSEGTVGELTILFPGPPVTTDGGMGCEPISSSLPRESFNTSPLLLGGVWLALLLGKQWKRNKR